MLETGNQVLYFFLPCDLIMVRLYGAKEKTILAPKQPRKRANETEPLCVSPSKSTLGVSQRTEGFSYHGELVCSSVHVLMH